MEILEKKYLEKEDLLKLIKVTDKEELEKLYKKAYETKLEYVGNKVYYRGIIELSNICIKDCYYCGIRKSSNNFEKFSMTEEDILESAKWNYENNYGSLVLQAGERQDEEYISFIEDIIKKIKKLSNNELGITLSLGEQSKKTYQRWFDAGAHRYLLRIETSNKELYEKLHPEDHKFEKRIEALKDLQKVGYQTGTGVMIGIPGQTDEDLVNDIVFFKEMDIDMIGMGPYILSKDTPTALGAIDTKEERKRRFELGLKMIALARIYLKDINIASTTALQALNPIGRELGLKAGANVMMPVITDKKYRGNYQLYNDKPCIDDDANDCKTCLANRIESTGDIIAYGEWGDSIHYKKK